MKYMRDAAMNMTLAKQADIRSNIKKYFDAAFEGQIIIVPRKQNKNVVILSEQEYNRLCQLARVSAYAGKMGQITRDGRQKTEKAVQGENDNRSDGILADNLRRLDQIADLKEDWNGNGAPAFPAALIDKVTELIRKLRIQPEIFPTALQTIQLEFDNSRHDHMELEIGEEDTVEIFIAPYQGMESFETLPFDASILNERIGAFYG